MYYVYTHYYSELDVPFYVGKGHGKRAHDLQGRSALWRRVAAKYGLRVVIVSDSLTESEAFALEVELISKYGRRDIGTGTLVNFTGGGEGTSGFKHSEEVKKRMSKVHTGKKFSAVSRGRMSAANKGKKLSDTTKLKLSEANRGKTLSDEHRARMAEGARQMWARRKANT